ncbi:hypothetical protein J5X84_05135 [Streptosporangiaceae bacterium NEAU-GS5]|nr:hypothetical protein [Streptosporangiaceae bacterium NEAU-GS5]
MRTDDMRDIDTVTRPRRDGEPGRGDLRARRETTSGRRDTTSALRQSEPGARTRRGADAPPAKRPAAISSAARAATGRTAVPTAPQATGSAAAATAQTPGPQNPGRGPRRAPRAPFVLLVVGLLCGGLVSLLLLNTVLAQDSFELGDLRSSTEQLRQAAAEMEGQVRVMTQPDALAEQARGLNVQPDTSSPGFVRVAPTSKPAGADAAGSQLEDPVR